MAAAQRYWLMKTEPEAYSIDDLERDGKTFWDGVRNYQARNFMTQDMRVGDLALVYHSNIEPPGVAGIARICSEAHPDFTAWEPENCHFDPKSTPENPRWFMVDIEFVARFPRFVPLSEMRDHPLLQEMLVLKRAQRLSVQPVKQEEFEVVRKLGGL